MPTQEQVFECFRLCCDLTRFYQPVFLVRLDERTENVYILAAENIQIEINPNGEPRFL